MEKKKTDFKEFMYGLKVVNPKLAKQWKFVRLIDAIFVFLFSWFSTLCLEMILFGKFDNGFWTFFIPYFTTYTMLDYVNTKSWDDRVNKVMRREKLNIWVD